MRGIHATAVLGGAVIMAPCALAQRTYHEPIRVTPLIGYLAPVSGVHEWFTPDGLATDDSGTLYVADSHLAGIHKVAPDGTRSVLSTFLVNSDGSRGAAFKTGGRLAIDAARNLYTTADYTASQRGVFKIAPDGATTRLASFSGWLYGVAADSQGNVYVTDGLNHVIYHIDPAGVLTTLAGRSGEAGNADGTALARFRAPDGIVVDSGGIVYVADRGNGTVRKVTRNGTVSTLANVPEASGIAVDEFGTLYVTEGGLLTSYRLRKLTPDGRVSTVGVWTDFQGNDSAPSGFGILTIDRRGTFYLVDEWYGTVLKTDAPPSLVRPVANVGVAPGGTATFSAEVVGTGSHGFSWMKDARSIPGATSATLIISNVQTADLGRYTVLISNPVGSVVSNPAVLSFVNPGRSALTNLSVRSSVGADAQSLILGFTLGGAGAAGTAPLLIRGIGPSLGTFGVQGTLADPQLTVFSGTTMVASNNDWNGDPAVSAVQAAVGAFALPSAASRDAALYLVGYGAGTYTAQISGLNGAIGVALAEVYDATPVNVGGAPTRLINLSARAQVGRGTDGPWAGFTIDGTEPRKLLVRAVGPLLVAFGVRDALADPQIAVFDSAGRAVAENDNWSSTGDADAAQLTEAAAKAGAFPLLAGSRDAALVRTLSPGSYTVHLSGVGGTSGVSLLEVYQVP
jgi:sugar lactone lactonase YvrE